MPINGTLSLYAGGRRWQALAGACGRQLHLAALVYVHYYKERAAATGGGSQAYNTCRLDLSRLDLSVDLVYLF